MRNGTIVGVREEMRIKVGVSVGKGGTIDTGAVDEGGDDVVVGKRDGLF